MTHARELPPIRKAIEVDASPAEAFRLWIGAIGRWWPLASHSVAQAYALDCTIEAMTGGRIFEITRAHEEHVWGQVTVFDPPHRLPSPGTQAVRPMTIRPSK